LIAKFRRAVALLHITHSRIIPMSDTTENTPLESRRGFLKSSVIAGAAASLSIERSAYAAGSDEIKIGIIGTGGRASGAAGQALSNPKSGVRVVAMGDATSTETKSMCLRTDSSSDWTATKAYSSKT
jgi:hypothetical protein